MRRRQLKLCGGLLDGVSFSFEGPLPLAITFHLPAGDDDGPTPMTRSFTYRADPPYDALVDVEDYHFERMKNPERA